MKRKIKGLVLAACVFLCAGRTGLFASTTDYVQPFSLDPVGDGVQLGLGLTLSGSALICDKLVHIKKNDFNPAALNKADVPSFEQIFMRPYSKPLHIVGTGTMALAIATPAIFAIMPSSEWFTIGTMYVETMLIANGIKEWAKLLVYRTRPYMYFDGYPQDKVADGDWNCSFPSGHTTLAFAAAAFTTMVYASCYPDSNWKYAVAGVSFALAAVTGGFRMASGNHFLTDVLIGAVIGTTCGFLVPYLHTLIGGNKKESRARVAQPSFSPAGFSITYKF